MRSAVLLVTLASLAGTAAGQDEAEFRRRLEKPLAWEVMDTSDLPEVLERVSRETGVPIRLEPEVFGPFERVADLPGRVRELLAGLASDEWADREEATAALVRLGGPGLQEFVRQAPADDPEVHWRIERVRAGVAGKALRPSWWWVFYHDPPVNVPQGTAADFLDWTIRPEGEWIVTSEGIRVAPAGKFARPFDRTRILASYLLAAVAGHDPFLTPEVRWRERLSRPMSLEWDSPPLEDVLDFFRDSEDVRIRLSERARESVEGTCITVSFKIRDLPYADALDLVASISGLRVDWSDPGEIVLRDKNEHDPPSPDETFAQEIADWLGDIRRFRDRFGEPAPPLAIPPGTSLAGITRPGGVVVALARATDRAVLADRATWRALERPRSPLPADSRDLLAWLAAEGIVLVERDDLLVLLGP